MDTIIYIYIYIYNRSQIVYTIQNPKTHVPNNFRTSGRGRVLRGLSSLGLGLSGCRIVDSRLEELFPTSSRAPWFLPFCIRLKTAYTSD